MEKEAIVLDKIKREFQFKQNSVIQCMSTSNFSILELMNEESAKIQEIIDTNNKIVRRISYNKLTTLGKKELEKAVETVIVNNPDRFINFFNNARPISLRRHQLDLLPMIGSKHRKKIIEYLNKNNKFTSFEDIKKISMMPDPTRIVVSRVMEEIKNQSNIKYHFFTIPYIKKHF